MGGSGKTPFVLALGKLLQDRGVAFDILTRGYGRSDSKVRLVDEKSVVSEGATLFGDEPLLLAQKLHVPVIVGPNRYLSGQYAEKLFSELKPAHGLWLHLLDDGFQHRNLARDFDIVIVQPSDSKEKTLAVCANPSHRSPAPTLSFSLKAQLPMACRSQNNMSGA
jgi:tetraacyldisaccharide 4'-kinase